MPTTTQCPNASCRYVTQLVDDPLGRIFRCPRCSTRLPTAPAAAADAGWTAVSRPSPRAGAVLGARRPVARNVAEADPDRFEAGSWAEGIAVATPGLGSSEIDGLEIGSTSRSAYGLSTTAEPGAYGPDESGEIVVDPVSRRSQAGSLVSTWGAPPLSRSASMSMSMSMSTSIAMVSSPSVVVGSGEFEQIGRFRVLEELGRGQHATVYRAYDPLLERDLALKVPKPGVLRTERALERFLGEVRAQARLRHPRIVPVFEAGRAGNRHYIAMALIEGQGLDDRLDEEGSMPTTQAAAIAADLAEALAYAHDLGVVHRDVKPANVRIDRRGDVYLMDFGIAYRPDSNEVPLPPGTILGTPAYVAPEQAEAGRSDPIPASDQYSLGAVFYELLCGRPPFVGPPSYVLYHTIHHEPDSPRRLRSRIPRAIEAICMKALAKDPSRRYDDCRALAEDLRRWLRGETPLACRRRGWRRSGR